MRGTVNWDDGIFIEGPLSAEELSELIEAVREQLADRIQFDLEATGRRVPRTLPPEAL